MEVSSVMQLDARCAAALLNVPEGKLDRLVADGGLPASRVDGRYRFDRGDLLEWAAARCVGVSAGPVRGAMEGPSLAAALEAGGVVEGVPGSGREAVFHAVAAGLSLPEGMSREELEALLRSRASVATTAVGEGIAVPHVRHPIIVPHETALTVCYLDRPADLGAKDGKPVHTLFVLISPTPRVHMRILSRVDLLLHDPEFRHALDRRAPREVLVAAARRAEEIAASSQNGMR
jgi:PTS system nitrogen regulatory IIA component